MQATSPSFVGKFQGRALDPISRLSKAETKPFFRQRYAPQLRCQVGLDEFPVALQKIVLYAYADTPCRTSGFDAMDLFRTLLEQRMPDPTSRLIRAGHEAQVAAVKQALLTEITVTASAHEAYASTLHWLDQICDYIRAYRSARGIFDGAHDRFVNEFYGANRDAPRKYPNPPVVAKPRAFALWRKIRNELYRALAHPVKLKELPDGERVEIEALGSIRYVMRFEQRSFCVEVLRAGGVWRTMPSDFEVLRPLRTDGWVRCYLERWGSEIANVSAAASLSVIRDLYLWLEECVRLEMRWNGLMPKLRNQIRQNFPLEQEVVDIALRLRGSKRAGPVYSSYYCRIWRRLEMWRRVLRETPTLAPLLNFAHMEPRYQLTRDMDPIAALKELMRGEGVSKRGWAMLATHGRRAYWPSVEQKMQDGPLSAVLDHIKLFQGFPGETPPSLEFQRTIYLERIVRDPGGIPPRLVQLAYERFSWHKQCGTERSFVFEQWLPLLSWFQRSNPRLSKAQWRGGWITLLALHRRSVDARDEEANFVEWDQPLPYFVQNHLEALAISSTSGLELESEVMVNCASDYADDCGGGNAYFFSIRDRNTRSRTATLMLSPGDKGWEVSDVRRIANQSPGYLLRAFSSSLAAAFNESLARSPYDEHVSTAGNPG
jgi:hypothetical protein